jgi:hypothetical protein
MTDISSYKKTSKEKTFLSVENVDLPIIQNLLNLNIIGQFKCPCSLRLRSAAANPAEHMGVCLVCLLSRQWPL